MDFQVQHDEFQLTGGGGGGGGHHRVCTESPTAMMRFTKEQRNVGKWSAHGREERKQFYYYWTDGFL